MTTPKLANIFRLGVKELWSLARDPIMIVLIVYTFSVSIYISGTAMPETLNNAPIAIVDEDKSPLSFRISSAFYPPQFKWPTMIPLTSVDRDMDAGLYTFVLDVPPNFQRDVLAGRKPSLQLNIDATRMSQAFTGGGYVQQIVLDEVSAFGRVGSSSRAESVELNVRSRFNPNLEHAWFGSLMELINNVTMLSIVLSGAALIREREHGTIEHLLVMPIRPAEIILAKVVSMGLVVLVSSLAALLLVVRGVLHVPIDGSVALFMVGTVLHLFATCSIGVFMATIARSMPQFGLLAMMVLLPLQLLSGNSTPRESMPRVVQDLMLLSPTTHYVSLGQAILFRGGGLGVVWPSFLALLVVGSAFFLVALARFRRGTGQSA